MCPVTFTTPKYEFKTHRMDRAIAMFTFERSVYNELEEKRERNKELLQLQKITRRPTDRNIARYKEELFGSISARRRSKVSLSERR